MLRAGCREEGDRALGHGRRWGTATEPGGRGWSWRESDGRTGGCSLLALPRGPCAAPLPGLLHAEVVAQCGPREGRESRHHPPLPPSTWEALSQQGFGFTLTPAHTCPETWRRKAHDSCHAPRGPTPTVRSKNVQKARQRLLEPLCPHVVTRLPP